MLSNASLIIARYLHTNKILGYFIKMPLTLSASASLSFKPSVAKTHPVAIATTTKPSLVKPFATKPSVVKPAVAAKLQLQK